MNPIFLGPQLGTWKTEHGFAPINRLLSTWIIENMPTKPSKIAYNKVNEPRINRIRGKVPQSN